MTGNPGMPRVLLVEDLQSLRTVFARLLRLQGFDVREAKDGQDALDCIAEFQPNLILTDMMMPGMGGIELIGRLRAKPEMAGVPVVAITAEPANLAEEQARHAGADDFITKPVDLPELVACLHNLLPAEIYSTH